VAVAFDAVGPSSSGKAWATSPTTWTHVCGASANALVVFVSIDGVAVGNITYTVTYNGAAMTKVIEVASGGSGKAAGVIALFTLLNPATGSNTVSVTTGSSQNQHAGSISFTGASSFGTAATGGTTTGTSQSVTVSSTTTGGMVTAGVTDGSDSIAFTTGTSRFVTSMAGGGAAIQCGGATIASTGAGTTINWTQASDWWAAIAVEVKPPATAGTITQSDIPGSIPAIITGLFGRRMAAHSR